jgi:hypothetical protein
VTTGLTTFPPVDSFSKIGEKDLLLGFREIRFAGFLGFVAMLDSQVSTV